MKLKVVKTREDDNGKWRFAIYHGFGFPISWNPFKTKWFLDENAKDITASELGRYISWYIGKYTIINMPLGSYQQWFFNKEHYE